MALALGFNGSGVFNSLSLPPHIQLISFPFRICQNLIDDTSDTNIRFPAPSSLRPSSPLAWWLQQPPPWAPNLHPVPYDLFCSNQFRCVSPCSKSCNGFHQTWSKNKSLSPHGLPSPHLSGHIPHASVCLPLCSAPGTLAILLFPPHSLYSHLTAFTLPPDTCMGCSFTSLVLSVQMSLSLDLSDLK